MSPVLVLLGLNALQAALLLLLAAVTLRLPGVQQPNGRRLLAASLAALAAHFALASASFWLSSEGVKVGAVRLAVSALSQGAAYAHLGLICLAMFAVHFRRPPHRHALSAVMGLAVLIGLLLTLPGAFDPADASQRLQLRLGVRYLLFACTYGVLAALILAAKPARGRSTGQKLIGGSFLVLALVHTAGLLFILSPALAQGVGPYSVWLPLVSLVGYLLLGVATLFWLNERATSLADAQRRASERAVLLDQRTGIASRLGLLETLQGSADGHQPLTVVAIRLLRFNTLQRTLGDAWAVQTLQRLATAMRAGPDCIAVGRIESNRFGVALAVPAERADAAVDALRRAVETIAVGMPQPVSLCLGYAVREDGSDADTVLAAACLAQERAETTGVRCLRYEAVQIEQDHAEVELVGALYRALGEDQLVLHLQGIYRADDLRLAGVEALLRWQHPSRGMLPPSAFLPAAERAGLMGDVDTWVMNRAASLLRERADAGLPVVPLSVNLSVASITDAALPRRVGQLLQQHGLRPDWLEFELTESDAMRDLATAVRNVEAMQALGVRVALDDLGTGYSSLSHLRSLPVDRLKIDRSFLTPGDRYGQAIASAIAALARQLGHDIVAEGVETPEQLAFCRHEGIALVQGWLLHRASATWPAPEAAPGAPL